MLIHQEDYERIIKFDMFDMFEETVHDKVRRLGRIMSPNVHTYGLKELHFGGCKSTKGFGED
jgi:hypothetical protein